MDTLEIDQKHFYQLAITNVRYALARDNHLAPWAAIDIIKNYVNNLSDTFKKVLSEQLIYEIERDLAIYNRDYEDEWYEFVKFLEEVK